MFLDKDETLHAMIDEVTLIYSNESNLEKRKRVYKMFVHDKYGMLEQGERRRMGVCTERMICMRFPNPEGDPYMGYKPS